MSWHLEAEPAADRATPSEEHKALLAVQANLVAAYAECREAGDEVSCEQIAEAGAERRDSTNATGAVALAEDTRP